MASSSGEKPFNTTALPASVPPPYPEKPPPLPKSQSLGRILKRTDVLVTRLSIILSTPSGTDSLLRTLTYTLQFLTSAVSIIATKYLQTLVKTIATRASAVPLLPGETLVVALAYPAPAITRLTPRARALSALISDFRTFTRLWGLLGMYSWGKSLLARPAKDPVLRMCAWGQCLAYSVYQLFENRAYLAGKGVIKREGKLILQDWLWSSRCWMVAVGLEFVRLGRVWQKWRIEDSVSNGKAVALTGEAKAKREREVAQWKGEAIVNLSNAPLTIHWSTDGGTLSDTAVGFLGMVAGLVGFRQRWKATAAQVAEA